MRLKNPFKKLTRFKDILKPDGKPDYPLVITFFVILGFGLLMLSSASAVVSFQRFDYSYFYLNHQLLNGVLPGLVAFVIASRINYRTWRKWALSLLVLAIVLLIAVLIPGIGYEFGGARRWINFGGFLFQPAEFAKLAFIIYLATWFSSKGVSKVKDFSQGYIPFLVLLGVVGGLILLQPDMGTFSIIVFISFVMYFVAGADMKHVLLSAAGGAGLFALLIKLATYRLQRFMTFLHPELDPLGVGYHINQALLAVGSGGMWGRGFGHSRQKFAYLPEAFGDSIFAIIAEELGFVFSVALLLLFIYLATRGMHVAKHAKDEFGKYMAIGIMTWITLQAFLNIGAMLSLVPLTGITLPFVSYGGSALLISMFSMGILVNISRSMSHPGTLVKKGGIK